MASLAAVSYPMSAPRAAVHEPPAGRRTRRPPPAGGARRRRRRGAAAHPRGHPLVEVDIPDHLPLACADPGLLERVVANLIANARAASPPDQPIRLSGDATARRVRLQVIDHGQGVPAADRERIFEPFQRLHDRSTVTGLGLGLAIARGFTEAMAGTITPTDTPGGGLTMTLTVPTAAETAEAGEPGTTP